MHGLGYLFGLHDQYIDNYLDAPSHNIKDLMVPESGVPSRVNNWAGGVCGHSCYTSAHRFVKRNMFEGVKELYFRHNAKPIVSEEALIGAIERLLK